MDLATLLFHAILYIIHRLSAWLASPFHFNCKPRHGAGYTLGDFDVDSATGFFPPYPLPRLQGSFSLWEDALDRAKTTLVLNSEQSSAKKWRDDIRNWPVLKTRTLMAELPLLQRAHMVLAFLVHFHVHSSPDKKKVVPKALAVPLVEVSKALGIAPILTFADTILWNARPADARFPLSPDNLAFEHLFSGTDDERAFYAASASAELQGIEALNIMARYMTNSRVEPADTAEDLERLAEIIDALAEVMPWVRARCDPRVFYDAVRPWFVGSEPGAAWTLAGVARRDCAHLSGPSAGQSAVMHALDAFLGVDHRAGSAADAGFMARMRLYMPRAHRAFLDALPSVRAREGVDRAAYNRAVGALRRLRDAHIRIACLYVVTMSKRCPLMARVRGEEGPTRGTGGLEVSAQLKAGRDATLRGSLDARR